MHNVFPGHLYPKSKTKAKETNQPQPKSYPETVYKPSCEAKHCSVNKQSCKSVFIGQYKKNIHKLQHRTNEKYSLATFINHNRNK